MDKHNEDKFMDDRDKENIKDNLSEEDILSKIKSDAESIEVPKSLEPDNMLEKLKAVEQKKEGVGEVVGRSETENSRGRSSRHTSASASRRWGKVAAIAASFAVVFVAGAFAMTLFRGAEDTSGNDVTTVVEAPTEEVSEESTEAEQGAVGAELSYDDVCELINTFNESTGMSSGGIFKGYAVTEEATEDGATSDDAYSMAENSAAVTDTGSSGGSADYSRTDEQVEGVAEGDIVKTDGRYIYTVEATTFGYTVHIIEPNGKKSKEISKVKVDNASCSEMYIYGGYIVTVGNDWRLGDDEIAYASATEDVGYMPSYNSNTAIFVTDITDVTSPKQVANIPQNGAYSTSRVSDGYLYTFSNRTYYGKDYTSDAPEKYIPRVDGELIPEGCIVRTGDDPTNNYMIMSSIDLSSPTKTAGTFAALGGNVTYYMNKNHIYTARAVYTEEDEKTVITKISYEKGGFKKEATMKIRGLINDSYMMHEYDGNLCFVYMRYTGSKNVNGLCVVDESLKPLGELSGIAPDEYIYASYFIDNMAYFVTYRNTDPVFAVDLSDPENPTLKSELKLPGYSSYLHSFGDDELIGIGYGQAKGDEWDSTTKISLFKIGEDYSITELSKVFADRGSSNIADSNHKAIFVDEERMLIGICTYNYDNEKDIVKYTLYKQSGKKLKKVFEKKLKSKGGDYLYDDYQSIRGVRIGETLYICDTSAVLDAEEIG